MKPSPIESKFPQKPECSYGEVVATDRGWEVVQPSGSKEILVSCHGLKTMMDADAGIEPELAPTIPAPVVITDPPPAFSESELAEQKRLEEERLAAAAKQEATGLVEGATFTPPEGAPNPVTTVPPEGAASTAPGETGANGSGTQESGESGTSGASSDTTGQGGDDSVALYTKEGLMALKMDEVRPIGKTFGVADTSKEKLVDKIIEAQAAKAAAQ
uniref:Uncharacterized protein n=1 Tax=Pseudomonas phage Cygsa01 TaxID=3138529 RepID=A0AAU6W3Y4_9VIRU